MSKEKEGRFQRTMAKGPPGQIIPLAFALISPMLRSGGTKPKERFFIKREIHILLVEDSSNDAVLFRTAVGRINPDATISHVVDATSASVFLKQDGAYPDAPRPDIIVCDSILNSESGVDLLEWVRVHPRFQDLPFVVLSGGSDPALRSRLTELGATAFFQKPADTGSFAKSSGRFFRTLTRVEASPRARCHLQMRFS
ncbi:MAG TPA: response regulator [Methylomirabilota bacterium]|nr:response regulator [Methylomirabilota bacterium]